jgi:hypothetical protein
MAIIPQIQMFGWENDLENLGDLTRLDLALKTIPDERLMKKLEKKRGHGRNDYPVRAMWNLLIAMIVFGHYRFADVLRELSRNVQMRYLCGFGNGKLPTAASLSRFVASLKKEKNEVKLIFEELVSRLYIELPGFGEELAIDSKWIWSMASRASKCKHPDGRSETEAAWGIKEYKGLREDGSEWSKTERCFGFKLHSLVDAKYELPIAYMLSDASGSDVVYSKILLEYIEENNPEIIEICKYLMADRGYDDKALIKELKRLGIKAVIDKRSMWRTETEKEVPGYSGIYYNERGEVFCYSPEFGERHEMRPAGYDAERDALRMKCPAKMYGVTCRDEETCTHCKNIRIPLSVDERIFTQVARPSYKWQSLYNKRTAVERVFSRLDVSFGFEARRIRGMGKAELFSTLSFIVMNAMALGRIKQKKPELMRSLTKAA